MIIQDAVTKAERMLW
jgi:hypothetical protein